MKPTLEQLNDPDWWDDNAPNGAKCLINGKFFKWSGGTQGIEYIYHDDRWVAQGEMSWSLRRYENNTKTFEIHKRPNRKPWMPEVGEWCKFKYKERAFYCESGEVKFIGDKLIVIDNGREKCYKISELHFEPMRSERDKWVEQALGLRKQGAYTDEQWAADIYDAGLAKLPEETQE